jgi:transcriptional regulator with XRE-family HTH domain
MTTQSPIRAFRERNRLKQDDLAKSVGVTVATISRWEQRLRTPRGDDLQRLCTVTGIPAAEILGMVDAPAISPEATE